MKLLFVLLSAAALALGAVFLGRARRSSRISKPPPEDRAGSTGVAEVLVSSHIEESFPEPPCVRAAAALPEIDDGDDPQALASPRPETLPNVSSLVEELGGLDDRDRQLTLLAVRVDDLPRVTRSFGDIVGQRALQEVARTIRRTLRPADSCARWESNRFVAVLTDLDRGTARTVVSRVQRAVRALSLVTHGGDELQLEVTVGSARFPEDGETFDDLLLAAGRKLESEATPVGPEEDLGVGERLRRAAPIVPN